MKAYCDFETEHQKDIFNKTGLYVRRAGSTLHLFKKEEKNGKIKYVDTGRIPESRVKCGAMVLEDDRQIVVHSVTEMLQEWWNNRITDVWFHNLKFDEYYITYELYENNGRILVQSNPPVYAVITDRMMNFQGDVYMITIQWFTRNGKAVKDSPKCCLYDSAKIWAQPLRKLGDVFGIAKGNEALREGCDAILEQYCIDDCLIVKKSMEEYRRMVQEFTNGERKKGWLTSASTAYNMGKIHTMKEFGLTVKNWNDMFPPADEAHGFPNWFRQGYKGATPLIHSGLKGKLVHNISVFDINSDYPFQMCTQRFPMGLPHFVDGRSNDDLATAMRNGLISIAKVRMKADVKKGHRATFLLKHKHNGSTLEPHINTDEPDQDPYHVITNVDFVMLERDYDIDWINFDEFYLFKPTMAWKDGEYKEVHIFEPFLMYWYTMKSELKKKAKREKTNKYEPLIAFAKLIINSFYGKFGADPIHQNTEYEFIDGKPMRVIEVDVDIDKRPKYLPFAMFVTAYARDYLSRACNAIGWDNVVYTDTDSVHVVNITADEVERRLKAIGMVCDGSTLGGWDREEDGCPMGVYIRPKGYVHANDWDETPVTDVKLAGANNFDEKWTLKDWMDKDHEVTKRRRYKVIGGQLIADMPVKVHEVKHLKTVVRTPTYVDREEGCVERMKNIQNTIMKEILEEVK